MSLPTSAGNSAAPESSGGDSADQYRVRGQSPADSERDFRDTLGRFATGVTVLTARTQEGQPIGVTISSFNSVSLDPPLILWSLSLNSPNVEAFRNASHYSVNVLAAGQQDLSNRFASRRNDRFTDIQTRPGLSDIPLLEGCCAWLECSNEAHYPGGDHLIFVGRVERFSKGEAESPLIFHNARYRELDNIPPGS
jgi:flavin reductase (DIM6/NTAB) family NADH-FMN oxidoreductase RutF